MVDTSFNVTVVQYSCVLSGGCMSIQTNNSRGKGAGSFGFAI